MDQAARDGVNWRIVGIMITCICGQAIGCIAFTGYSVGAFVYPLSHEFGWSRQAIFLGLSLVTTVTLATSFTVGWLTDKVSPRWLIIPSQIAFGLGFIILAKVTTSDIRIFYGMHLLLAVLGAGSLPIVFNRIVATTFVKNRGKAFGLMLAGTGLGGFVIPPYANYLIETVGWRAAYVGLGALPIAEALLLSMFLLPRGKALATVTVQTAASAGLTPSQAVRGWRIWVMAASFFIGAGLTNAMVANLSPMLRDQGLSVAAAAAALSVFGLSVIAGRLLVGALLDRFWAPPIAVGVMVPAALVLVYLAAVPPTLASALVCAAVLGLAAGAEGDMLSYLSVKYFGVAHTGRIYAFLFVFFVAGIGVAGPMFGAVFDHFGNYKPALYAGGVFWVICGLLLTILGPYPAFASGHDDPDTAKA